MVKTLRGRTTRGGIDRVAVQLEGGTSGHRQGDLTTTVEGSVLRVRTTKGRGGRIERDRTQRARVRGERERQRQGERCMQARPQSAIDSMSQFR